MITVYHTCRKCGHEIEIDYDLGEHFAEIGSDEECDACGEKLDVDYEDLEGQASSAAADRVDYYSER